MYNDQCSEILHTVTDLVTWLDSDVVLNDPGVAALFVQRAIKRIFHIPSDILIACYPDKLQIGNLSINYPFCIEGVESMVDLVLADPETNRNAVILQTQNSLFDT